MLTLSRPSSYPGNLVHLNSDFYEYPDIRDEVAASLIAKNIRKLLQKGPSVAARRRNISECVTSEVTRVRVMKKHASFSLEPTSNDNGLCEGVNSLFQSDTSLSSNSSFNSLDSYDGSLQNSSNNASPSSSYTSLADMCKRSKSRSKRDKVEVVLPDDMMSRVVRDIIRMSERETHGIRGCRLVIDLTDSEGAVRVGRINCDPKILPTFTVKLNLSLTPPPVQYQNETLISRLLGSSTSSLYIKSGYTLEKLKHAE